MSPLHYKNQLNLQTRVEKWRVLSIFKVLSIMKKVWIILRFLVAVLTDQQSSTTQQDSITVLDYLAVIGLYGLSAITMYTAGVISLLILAFVIPVKEAKRRKLLNILFPLIPVFRPIMNNLPHGQRVWFESKIQLVNQDDLEPNPEEETRATDTEKWKVHLRRVNSGTRGLQNLGNTCYLNSALQCLHKTFELEKLCTDSEAKKHGRYKDTLLQLFDQLSKGNTPAFKPTKIKRIISTFNPMFEGFDQQDSSQVLVTILRMIHEEMNEVQQKVIHPIDTKLRRSHSHSEQLWRESKKKDQMRQKSIIDDIIYGRFKTTYTCQQCGELYILFQRFHAIYLPLPQDKKKLTLKDCFGEFSKSQLFDGNDAMNCQRCQGDRPTTKIMTPYQTNQILILCLRRFIQGTKDKRKVDIPMVIDEDLLEGNRQKCKYELYGVINHSGSSLHCGHYTASCFDENNGWMNYNDSYCRKTSEEEVKDYAKNGLVFLYRKI